MSSKAGLDVFVAEGFVGEVVSTGNSSGEVLKSKVMPG
jgi:hypothetical protein